MPPRLTWSHLTSQQLGAYAEHFVTMQAVMRGLQVFRPEVDDRGIDLVLRREPDMAGGVASYWDVQVKSLRISQKRSNYAFMKQSKFVLRANLLLALALFQEGEEPGLYLIPAFRWRNPDMVFSDRRYGKEGQTSIPEYGLQVSLRLLPLLEVYRFDETAQSLFEQVVSQANCRNEDEAV